MNYKKPAFWIVILAVIACIAVAICFLTNPEGSMKEDHGYESQHNSSSGVRKWFDYTEAPSQMSYGSELKIQLDEFPDVTFKYNSYEIIAATSWEDDDTGGNTILFSGMPVWNAYFTDLTGDGLPEICSELSYGSGIIDNRVIIFDYANGISYRLDDRGIYDYFLRMDDTDGCLYVDKKRYNEDVLVSTEKLVFKNGCVQLESVSAEPVAILQAKLLEINDVSFLVEPVEGSWEPNSADRIEISIKNVDFSPEPQVGDILQIEYNGQLQETYPARISEPYRIIVLKEGWGFVSIRFYLTIGAEGVKRIEVTTLNSSGGCENADGSLYKKGERIWLENLAGCKDLRGLTITALRENGEIVWTTSVPITQSNGDVTHLVDGDWKITTIE